MLPLSHDNRSFSTLLYPAFDLADDLFGRFSEMAKKAPEEPWPETDNLLQIGRDLSSQGEHDVPVLPELGSEATDLIFRRRCNVVPLDFTEVGRLDSDAPRDLSQ